MAGLAPLVERRGSEGACLTAAVLLVTGFMVALAFTHTDVVADFALVAATGFLLLTRAAVRAAGPRTRPVGRDRRRAGVTLAGRVRAQRVERTCS